MTTATAASLTTYGSVGRASFNSVKAFIAATDCPAFAGLVTYTVPGFVGNVPNCTCTSLPLCMAVKVHEPLKPDCGRAARACESRRAETFASL